MATHPIPESVLREAVAAVAQCDGVKAAAARSLGLPRATLVCRLAQATHRGITLESSAVPDNARRGELQARLDDSLRRIKELERRNAVMVQTLEDERAARVEDIAAAVTKRGVIDGDFVRVVIPDTHGNHIDRAAAGAFLADLQILDPAEIVLLGDHLDCGGFLAQHHALKAVEDVCYSYTEDKAAANLFLDQVAAAAPHTKSVHYLAGNHESRVEAWCVEQSLRNKADAQLLLDALGPANVLTLRERGITYHPPTEYVDGMRVAGVIQLGRCFFCHGVSHAVHATAIHVRRFGGNVVHGHTHRIQSYHAAPVASGEIAGWGIGCLCKFHRRYAHGMPHDWGHGYGVQFVRKDGTFMHITVPILDGRSLLAPLLDRLLT